MLRGFDPSSCAAKLSNCISFLTSFDLTSPDLTSEAQGADVGHFVVLQRVDVGHFVVLQGVDVGPFVVLERADVGQFVVLQGVDVGPFVVLQRVDGPFVVLQGVDVGQFVVLQRVDVGNFVVLERVDDGHLLVLTLPVDSSSSIFCAGRRQYSTIKKWCSVYTTSILHALFSHPCYQGFPLYIPNPLLLTASPYK